MIAGDEIHAEERMNLLDMLINGVVSLLPMGLVVFIGGGGIWLLNRIMTRRSAAVPGKNTFRRQLILTVLSTLLLLAIIVTAPLPESTRANLITLFGIALTATIAISSTTLASNAMAGLMLRIVNNFQRGDFIRIDQFLGRVTEQGLFHTEIQNERSDLVTLPNLFVVSTPVTVIRPSGTFISANISLGYDLPHDEIEKHLIEAAESAGLLEPFIRILELGDFSVLYQVSGRLSDTKNFLGGKTALHRAVLDTLHRNGIEIVSPNFMNQRQITDAGKFIPKVKRRKTTKATDTVGPDTVVFDKADQVEKAEDLRKHLKALDEQISTLEAKAKEAKGKEAEGKEAEGEEVEQIKETIFLRQQTRERLVKRIEKLEAEVKE
jgi:small conductance mechanosensitive channel